MISKKKIKEFFALERNIIAITLANVLWATVVLFKGFLPKFYSSLGASVFVVGLLFSVTDLFYALASFIGGHLSDAYGRKYILVRTAIITNLMFLGFFFAPNWVFLIPFIIFANLSAGIEDASAQTLIAESLPKKKRATGLASVLLAATLVSTFLAPLGAYLVQSYGIIQGVKSSILISFILGLMGTMIFVFLGKETMKRKITKQTWTTFNFSNLKSFFHKLPGSVKRILFFVTLLYFSNSLLTPYWIFYSLDIIKISAFQFGVLMSIQFVTVSFFMFVGAKLSDKYDRKKILLISVLVSSLIPLLFIFSINFLQLVIVYIISSVGTLGSATIFAYVAENIHSKDRSKAMGITNGIMTIVAIPAPFIGSILYTIFPQYPFIFSSALLLIDLVIGIKFLK
jgi:MFS family permease